MSMKSWLVAALLAAALAPASGEGVERVLVPVAGPSRLADDSNPDYINDHSVIRAEDGRWHLIGITHRKVLGGRLPVPQLEEDFAHATADALEGPWERRPDVLPIDWRRLENHVWAPHLIYHDGLYYCFYAGGGGHWTSMINLAVSEDLFTWRRHPANPLFRDFYDARDPMVLADGGRFILYYTKSYALADWVSTVAYRLSDDLVHWSEPDFALTLGERRGRLINSGQTESPFVVKVGDLYYLFYCSPDLNYRTTIVHVSDDPLHFEEADEIATIDAHAAEVIKDGDRYWLSSAGWFYDGLYLAPLEWKPARRVSPPLLADCGETDDFLESAAGAKVARYGLYQALEAGAGAALDYRFPIPAAVGWLSLVIDASGELKVTVGDQGQLIVLDEGDEGRGEPTVHVINLTAPGLWAGGELKVSIQDSSPDPGDGPIVSYLKVYLR